MNVQSPFELGAPSLLPLFADLRDRAVLVLGGGSVARRKAGMLLEAGAGVRIVAAVPEPTLRRWIDQGRVRWLRGAFEPVWLDEVWLVVAASRDHALNRAVSAAAEARRIFVNVVDDAEASSVHVPARVRRGPLQIAISTRGAAPVLARRLRGRLEAELDPSLGDLTRLLARERGRIRRRFPQPERRRRFYDGLLDGEVQRLLGARDHVAAQTAFEDALASGANALPRGSVALVGAGPGDPGLLTLNGLCALQEADVILHDRLVGPGILELARRDAECIDVGKRVGEDHDAAQARIHALLRHHARAGQRVVRLQGGDPLVFGRGGEELEFLRANAIPHEVIPGVTAALGCAAAAGIALTDRRYANRLTLVTARGGGPRDWRSLAEPHQTVAIYMGLGELETFTRELLAAGRQRDTPFVLVENGSSPRQRVIAGELADLPQRARAENVQSPALVILGEVAAHAASVERCRGRLKSPIVKAA
ncbi:MAG: siroheme synthase CysG [Rhodanobacteraceae bacterium]